MAEAPPPPSEIIRELENGIAQWVSIDSMGWSSLLLLFGKYQSNQWKAIHHNDWCGQKVADIARSNTAIDLHTRPSKKSTGNAASQKQHVSAMIYYEPCFGCTWLCTIMVYLLIMIFIKLLLLIIVYLLLYYFPSRAVTCKNVIVLFPVHLIIKTLDSLEKTFSEMFWCIFPYQ